MAEAKSPEPIVQYCVHCQDTRGFKVRHVTAYFADENGLPEEVSLAFCPKCSFPALFGREIYGTDQAGDDILSDYYRLYPGEERAVAYRLPKLVKESYDEAVRCERAKAWIATVTMVRRALEAISRDYLPTGRKDLFTALNKMHTDGVISDEMKEWADGLRSWGNLGAHANPTKISAADATSALDFLQALMEIIYELRPKFAAWQATPKPKASVPKLRPQVSSPKSVGRTPSRTKSVAAATK